MQTLHKSLKPYELYLLCSHTYKSRRDTATEINVSETLQFKWKKKKSFYDGWEWKLEIIQK